MDVEEIWQHFQKHMEYTDEEMQVFKSDPVKVKMEILMKVYVEQPRDI